MHIDSVERVPQHQNAQEPQDFDQRFDSGMRQVRLRFGLGFAVD